MKRLLLLILGVLLLAVNVWAQPPSGGGCVNNCTFTGTTTYSGSSERIQGTDSYIDFNDPTATGSIRQCAYGLTNNECLDADFETTANAVIFSSPTSADTLYYNELMFNIRNDGSATNSLSYYGTANYGVILDFLSSRDTDVSDGYDLVTTTDNTNLGIINFRGVDTGNSKKVAAAIYGRQDGSAGATKVPGELKFFTSDGSNPIVARLSIKSTGEIQYAGHSTMPTCDADSNGGVIFEDDGTNDGLCLCVGNTWYPVSATGLADADCS